MFADVYFIHFNVHAAIEWCDIYYYLILSIFHVLLVHPRSLLDHHALPTLPCALCVAIYGRCELLLHIAWKRKEISAGKCVYVMRANRIWIDTLTHTHTTHTPVCVVDWFKNVLFIESEFLIAWNELWFQVRINRFLDSNRFYSSLFFPLHRLQVFRSNKINFSFYCYLSKPLTHSFARSLTFVSIFSSSRRYGSGKKENAKSFWTQWISFKILFQFFFFSFSFSSSSAEHQQLVPFFLLRIRLNFVWMHEQAIIFRIYKWKAK